MDPSLLQELAHFRYPRHFAYVYQYGDSGRIHCLKYNTAGYVRWEHFEYTEWDLCKEWMITDLPDHSWGFQEDSD